MTLAMKNHLLVFSKTQVAAALATALDVFTLWSLVEWGQIHYSVAVVLGAFVGGVFNFLANRFWSFQVQLQWLSQIRRYATVWGGSLFWNTFLVVFLTEFFDWNYLWAKAIVVGVVALAWNYPLQRYWVFKIPN